MATDAELNNLSLGDIERIAAVVNAYEGGQLFGQDEDGGFGPDPANRAGQPVLSGAALRPVENYDGFIAAVNDTGASIYRGQFAVIRGRDNDGNLLAATPDKDSDPAAVVCHSEEIPAGEIGLFVTAAMEPTFVDVSSTDFSTGHAVVGTQAGSVTPKSGNSGFLILGPGDGTTGSTAMRAWLGNAESDTSGTFTIDRTDADDDEKAWNPANDEPQDWKDYDSVELITQVARFTEDGSIEFAKFSQIWAALNAPVILAAETEDAGTTCEE